MAPQTRYARNGDCHIAYQTIGDGPIDVLWVPQSFSSVEVMWRHPIGGPLLRADRRLGDG